MLDKLLGLEPNNTAQKSSSIFDFSDPQKAAAWKMISNGTTPSVGAPRPMFQGVGDAYSQAQLAQSREQEMEMKKQDQAQKAQGKSQTRQWLIDNNHHDLLQGLDTGALTMRDVVNQGMKRAQDKETASKEQAKRDQQIEYLRSQGVSEDQLNAVNLGLTGTDDIYKSSQGGGATYGKSPVYGTDPETGDTILGVVGDDGTFKKLDTGDFNVANGFEKIDTGTEIILRDKRTGEIASVTPKENYQKKFDEAKGAAEGKARGENNANLGAATNGINETISLVDDLLIHPSLPDAVGPIDGILPSFRAGSRDFDERVEQIKNKAFIGARQELKGGGAITDFEGTKAENALLRASQAKSEEDFIKAMNEFKAALARGKAILALQAGQQPPIGEVNTPPVNGQGQTNSGISWSVE